MPLLGLLIQVRLMGNLCLNGGIPWHFNTLEGIMPLLGLLIQVRLMGNLCLNGGIPWHFGRHHASFRFTNPSETHG